MHAWFPNVDARRQTTMSTEHEHPPLHQPSDRGGPNGHANLMAFLDAHLPSAIDRANAAFPDEPPLLPMLTAEEVTAMLEAGNRRCREAAKASFDLFSERFLKSPNP